MLRETLVGAVLLLLYAMLLLDVMVLLCGYAVGRWVVRCAARLWLGVVRLMMGEV
jgi:hypothetical protein